MPGRPQARMAIDMHGCMTPFIPPPPPPGVPAPLPILPPCSPNVRVNFMSAARVYDLVAAATPHPITMGSVTVRINSLPAARMGDLVGCGGTIMTGSPNVIVGG